MENKEQNTDYFYTFLKARRKKMGITLSSVAKGICSISTVQRIERDEIVVEKMLRNRIMARLGISEREYENYLPPKEYERWTLRQEILKHIEKKQFLIVDNKLEEYKKRMPKKSIERQFVATMEFMVLQMSNAPIFEQRICIENAVKETICMKNENFPKELLLDTQELNLLVEYIALHGTGINERDVMQWRIKQYEEVIAYIENSHIDEQGRAKIYPKVVYYWMKSICDFYKNDVSDVPKQLIEYGLKISETAIELLRNTMKLFYFMEILELRKIFISGKLKYVTGKETKELEELLETTTVWHKLFMELYTEYEVSPYMEHFCHLYWEMQSYPMGEVVKIRRKMKGITKEKLSDETCDLKSITRCEKERVKTQKYTIRDVFPKVGLGIENICSGVVTSDYETVELYEKMKNYANVFDFVEWEKYIYKLEKRLSMDIAQNKQIIEMEMNWLLQCKNMISDEELQKNLISSLENTISLKSIVNYKNGYITQKELIAIYRIAKTKEEKEEEKYLKILRDIFEDYEKINGITPYILTYEFIMTEISSEMGNIGRYDESTKLSKKVIKECLKHRRSGLLGHNYYGILWNTYKKDIEKKNWDKDVLEKCKFLCEVAKRKNWLIFLEEKIADIVD